MQPLYRFIRFIGRGVYALIAFPLALLYGIVISTRNWLYDRGWLRIHRLSRTVVSIGNLTLGGSGKTPFAIYLLEWLTARGIPAAYLSRGYGRRTKGFAEVSLQIPEAAYRFGDEACLVKAHFPDLPVAVSEDRVQGGRELLQRYPHLKVLVLDDAYQHRRIHRDLDILVIDMQRPIWRDWLFPLGRLREPLHAHRRAHLIILNKKTSGKPLRLLKLHAPALTFGYTVVGLMPAGERTPPLSPEKLRYRSAMAFCGIARPESFYTTLRQAGAYIIHHQDFPDHHAYTERELMSLRREFRRYQKQLGIESLLLLTTEKDLVRLRESGLLHTLDELPLYAVQIAMRPENPEQAEAILHRFFGTLS